MTDVAHVMRHAPWPVWKDSHQGAVRSIPLPKQKAVTLFHKALERINFHELKRADRRASKRCAPRHTMKLVLHALIFGFLNYKTGELYPAHDAIAAKAGCSVRSVARAIRALRELKILGWLRRCASVRTESGRFELKQESNFYWLNSPEQWGDLRQDPPPLPESWGRQLALPSMPPRSAVQSFIHSGPRAVPRGGEPDPDELRGIAELLTQLAKGRKQ